MGLFGVAHVGGPKRPPLLKICHTYPIMIKLVTVVPYLKKIPKIYKSRDIPLSSADTSILSPEIIKSSYIKKYRYRMHFDKLPLILLSYFESLRIVLINIVIILMMSAKMAGLGLLRIKVF